MKRIKTILPCIVLFMSSFILTSGKSIEQYPGTNIRGKIMTRNYYGQLIPAANIQVDLYSFNTGSQQWVFHGNAYTDGYGFYYFRLVRPGNYSIQLNRRNSYNISVVQIDYRYFTFQDIQVIYL